MTTRETEIQSVPRARLDHFAEHGSPHLRPIVLAVRDGGCAFAIVTQGHHRFDLPLDKPTITLIGDDLFESLGPAGFHRKSLRRLLARCRSVSIVACEPIVAAYAAPAAASVGFKFHSAIVETRARHEGDWQQFVTEHAPQAAVVIATVKPDGGMN